MVQTFVCSDIVRSSCGWTELSTHVTFGRHLALISGNTQKKLNDYYLFSNFFFDLICSGLLFCGLGREAVLRTYMYPCSLLLFLFCCLLHLYKYNICLF